MHSATRALAVAGLFALFFNSLAVVADVILRVLFAAPIDRLSDVSGMIFVVSAACCLPVATATRRHITIRTLDGTLGERSRAAVEALAALLATVVFGLITWQLWIYVLEVHAGHQTLSQIDIPVAPFWVFVTGCLLLTTLAQAQVFLDFLRQAFVRGNRGDGRPPGEDAPADRPEGAGAGMV